MDFGKRMVWMLFVLPVLGQSHHGNESSDPLIVIHREIILINLIHGLHLSENQMRFVLQKIDEAERVRISGSNTTKALKSHYLEVLEEIRAHRIREEEIPQNLAYQFHEMKEAQYRNENLTGDRLMALETEVIDQLTPNQRIVIETYKPCIIPPEEGRIGQSTEAALHGLVHLLQNIRQMENDQIEMARDMIVDQHLHRIEKQAGRLDDGERDEITALWIETIKNVRILSDQDFMVQKSDLARALIPESVTSRKFRKNQPGKTGRFLLDPVLKPILQKRLSQ